MRYVTTMMVLAAPALATAQRGTPEADVFLAPITMSAGKIEIGTPVNATARPGYDNQPSFTPDSRGILYTSTRDDGQSDIYRIDVATHAITRVTATPESEYSATVTPAGDRFSVIRVERDSTQRLWSFRLDGSDAQLVLTGIKPVGYHAWADATHIALFVLGAGRAPATLQLADVKTGKADTLASGIGQSLLTIPGGHGFSYVQYGADTSLVVVALDAKGAVRDKQPFVKMPFRTSYVAWLGPKQVIAGKGSTLIVADASGSWTQVADLANAVTGITRLTVSPDGKWLAFVGAPVQH